MTPHTVAQTQQAAAPTQPPDGQDVAVEPAVMDELLVEDVSIDGMCGVY